MMSRMLRVRCRMPRGEGRNINSQNEEYFEPNSSAADNMNTADNMRPIECLNRQCLVYSLIKKINSLCFVTNLPIMEPIFKVKIKETLHHPYSS